VPRRALGVELCASANLVDAASNPAAVKTRNLRVISKPPLLVLQSALRWQTLGNATGRAPVPQAMGLAATSYRTICASWA